MFGKKYSDKGIELFRITTQRADRPNREARDVYFVQKTIIVRFPVSWLMLSIQWTSYSLNQWAWELFLTQWTVTYVNVIQYFRCQRDCTSEYNTVSRGTFITHDEFKWNISKILSLHVSSISLKLTLKKVLLDFTKAPPSITIQMPCAVHRCEDQLFAVWCIKHVPLLKPWSTLAFQFPLLY